MTKIKLLILSDSHGDVGAMVDAVEREKPDEIIHLGDCWQDAEELGYVYPELPMVRVPGNCDFVSSRPGRMTLEREGKIILLAHGHQWRVKSGPLLALEAGREQSADIVLYGHTHQAICRQELGMWLMNPGTVGGRHAPASYGVIALSQTGAELSIRPLK